MAVETGTYGTIITGERDTRTFGLMVLRKRIEGEARHGMQLTRVSARTSARRRFGLAPRANTATILAAIDAEINRLQGLDT